MKTALQKITECRKRVEAEKSVCKWCRSHATQVTSRGHVVRYACGVSHDRQFDRWFILDTACDRFRMRNRIKQLEREVKALRKRVLGAREHHRIYRLLVRQSQSKPRYQMTEAERERLVDVIFQELK